MEPSRDKHTGMGCFFLVKNTFGLGTKQALNKQQQQPRVSDSNVMVHAQATHIHTHTRTLPKSRGIIGMMRSSL